MSADAFVIVISSGVTRVVGPFRTRQIAQEYARSFYGRSTGPDIDIVSVKEPSLAYVRRDPNRRATPIKRKKRWSTLSLYYTDGQRMSPTQAHAALSEYRRTGGILDGWFVNPITYRQDDPENAGPAVNEIDWSGF